MKARTTVWTLAWDTATGTNCRVFGSEAEWLDYFRKTIEAEIVGIDTPEAEAIRTALRHGEIGTAYELWQEHYKNELDTYNWSFENIEVEVAGS